MNTILAYLESHGSGLKRASLEVITAACDIASVTGAKVVGVLTNGSESNVQAAGEYGLTECVIVRHPQLEKVSSTAIAAAITQVAEQEKADYVLFAANAAGKEIAPRVAVKLQAGYLPDCVSLSAEGGTIIAKRPIYAGKALISQKTTTPVGVLTLRPNVFTGKKRPAQLTTREFSPNLTAHDARVTVTGVMKNEGKLDVAEADIIVSGGRGLKGPENYHLVEELAAVLGGAVGASRAVVDAGWRPHSEQVGQTGKTVSPNLYIACGISGAVQHLAGMSSSKVIVAINKDKEAPIFKLADYGIVGDSLEVLPQLSEMIRQSLHK